MTSGSGPLHAGGARESILDRIRQATAPRPPARPAATPAYGLGSPRPQEQLVDELVHWLTGYGASATRVDAARIGDAVTDRLAAAGRRRLAIPHDLPETWAPAGYELTRDDGRIAVEELDDCEGALTACRLAIAETGTIVLDGGPGQGRRLLSLLPDYHLCVIVEGQIVGSVPEAIRSLDPARPLTFVSGPSATVDIEFTRVGGVHGPRTLDVIVAEGPR
ncbi:MAG TPA: LUD domain-containing protein [Acidimicrobiales bacterium]|nr:LUD domain-containing protein [Acidimicrobiales bacterium]